MWLFGGIDGGGSKTALVVVDEQGREVGRRQIGSSNYRAWTAQGLAPQEAANQVAAHMVTALLELTKAANGRLVSVTAGLSGVDIPQDVRLLCQALERASAERGLATDWTVINDVELLLYALPGSNGTGLAVVAGTGSIACGRDTHNKSVRAGGWGFLFGDEGSGYAIGRAALQAIAQAADFRGPATKLVERVLSEWKLQTPEDLITAVYEGESARNPKIARLAEVVLATAAEGDEVALEITRQAAWELARAVIAVYRQLNFEATNPPALALGGSLLVKNEFLRREVLSYLEKELPIKEIVRVTDPALAVAQAASQVLPAKSA